MSARVRNLGNKKAVTFDPDIHVEAPGFCGVVSSITWNNPAVMEGLRSMFHAKRDEQIVAIELSDEGIKAKFEMLTKVSSKRR